MLSLWLFTNRNKPSDIFSGLVGYSCTAGLTGHRKALKGALWELPAQQTLSAHRHSGSVPWCSCCQAHRGCRPPRHRPGGWTGRCWPDTPCTGWCLCRCSGRAGRARRTSPTAQSPGRRRGRRRPHRPQRWSPWWSRSWPCHWWTVCSGTRAREASPGSHPHLCACPWLCPSPGSCTAAPGAALWWQPLAPCEKPGSFNSGRELWQWVPKECCAVQPHT